MGLKPLISFSSGELDPILHDFTTLEKFKRGLATARNVMIGKTGGIISRFSRAHFATAKNADEPIRIFCPPGTSILIEFGLSYLRTYSFAGTYLGELAYTAVYPTGITAAQLTDMHMIPSGDLVYLFIGDKRPVALNYVTRAWDATAFGTLGTSYNALTITAVAVAGYAVDYAIGLVYDGEEYIANDLTTSHSGQLKPIAAGQSNTLAITTNVVNANIALCTEVRVYRRPTGGGAFGYIGSTNNFTAGVTYVGCSYIDLGGDADFTNGPPSSVTDYGLQGIGPGSTNFRTGCIYQQRLLTSPYGYEAIIASRPGYQNNILRDFPYDADSALLFKSGAGRALPLRMIDNDGLVVFTSQGVYVNLGLLNIDNVVLEKKGSWVINEDLAPLVVPGGVFFVDVKTNAVRHFIYSDNIRTYEAPEQSIFSNHLFKYKTIVSWAYQSGVAPLIIAVFSDGTFATFTYNLEHEMRAWTRHDSVYPIEEVAGTDTADSTFFVTNKDGQRYIEVSLPRYIPADTYESNPEADKINLNCFADAVKTKSNLLNDSLDPGDEFELTPVVADTWDGSLTLTCGTSALFPAVGLGAVGTIFRFFDTTDKSSVDLEVTARASDDEVTVLPSCTFPSAQATDFRMYQTYNTIDGLAHLEGEEVTVMVDGYVVASPNNDVENFPTLTVASGEIDLPDNLRGAITIVGRPITADAKTLNITTVEQKPTTVESLTVNKLYIRLHETRGLYASNKFPEESDGEKDGSSVEGMQDLDIFDVPDGYDIVGNRYKQPVSKRLEFTLPGSWNSQGEISLRQVDPLHFEILSIIPDVEVFYRSN